jgi:hypothetical protein
LVCWRLWIWLRNWLNGETWVVVLPSLPEAALALPDEATADVPLTSPTLVRYGLYPLLTPLTLIATSFAAKTNAWCKDLRRMARRL